MTARMHCPPIEHWQKLVDEALDEVEQAGLQEHLENCSRCREVLVHVASQGDSMAELMSHLRRQPAKAVRDPLLERAMDEIRAQTLYAEPPSGHGSTANMTLDFLAPADNSDHLGRLGPYQIIEAIGCGGMGMVLKGHDSRLNRFVAIKVLAPPLAANSTARKRFRREGQAAAAVAHDHVITIHAVDESDGVPYLVMELIAGRSLEERIKQTGPLHLNEILRIGMQTANGLAAAHAQGLVHRDIKPANILLENGIERVKITDFGLARAVDDVRITQPGVVTGTPEYMSPEQARGEPVDHRSDLFSLGCVLYAMCTGRPPFRAENTVAMVHQVCEGKPRPIVEINPDIPDWLSAIIEKLLAKVAADRFQSAAEVGELLEAHLAHLQQPSVHPRPAAVELPANRRLGKHRGRETHRRWHVAALVALLFLGGWGLTEATGVTEVVATLIRVVRGDGTLVVEVDDPNIQVLIDGEELVITGAGPKEIRLRPGKHEVHAVEDGKPIETRLVTIARGGREVVKVSREESATVPSAAALAQPVLRQVDVTRREYPIHLSSDGTKLAFTDSKGRIAVKDLTTGRERAYDEARGWYPVFSADGKRVAYQYMKDYAEQEIKILTLGSGEVIDTGVQGIPKDWSADGKSLLFVPGKLLDTKGIELLNIADKQTRTIYSASGEFTQGRSPDLSPDGKYVVLAQKIGDNIDVYAVPLEGGDPIRLTDDPAIDKEPIWSPDGQVVLFKTNRSQGRWDLAAIRITNGKAVGETFFVRRNLGPTAVVYAWSYSGRLLLETRSSIIHLYSVPTNPLTGVPEAPPKQLSSAVFQRNWEPAWSPDGKRIAFLAKRDEGDAPARLTVMAADGTNHREITRIGMYIGPFAWLPDNEHIVCASPSGGPGNPLRKDSSDSKGNLRGLYSVSVTTGEIKPIYLDPEIMGHVDCSPDGKRIVFLSGWKIKQICTVGVDGKDRKQITTGEASVLYPRFSPDGKEIIYTRVSGDAKQPRRSVMAVPVEGGEPREIYGTDKPEGKFYTTSSWLPDAMLTFESSGRGDGGKGGVWAIAADGSKAPETIAELDGFNYRVSPKGTSAVFQKGDFSHDLWLMENFLPPLNADATAVQSTTQPNVPSGTITRQVWPNAADITGEVSRDGRYLAFVDWDTGDLAIRNLATGENRRLTKKGSWNDSSEFALSPRFTPDGKRIAYTWFNDAYDIRVVSTEGGEPNVLYSDAGRKWYPYVCDWTPDGMSMVAVLDGNEDLQIAQISVGDRSVRVIKMFERRKKVGQVMLSPDGRWIACSRADDARSTNRDLFLLDVETGQETKLTGHASDEKVLAWAPDGQRLLVAMARQGAWDAWMVRISDGKAAGDPVLVKPDIGTISAMGMTSDGTLYYGLDIGGPGIFTAVLEVEKRTAKPRPLPEEQLAITDQSSHPTWSADGKYLAYKSVTANRSQRIKIVNMETDEARVLQPDLNFLASFRWAPDGQSFISSSQKEPGRLGIYQIDAGTGEITAVVEQAGEEWKVAGQARWSPDGRGIYYVKHDGIVYRDLESKDEREILAPDNAIFDEEFVLQFDVSPDSRQLAVLGREQNSEAMIIRLVTVGDGASRELVRMEKSGVTRGGVVWEPDGRSLLFLKSGGDESKRGLWRIAADGGEPQKIDVPGIKVLRDLTLHPDGKQIAFNAVGVRKFEVWAMEDFLPPE
ncbi:MAG: protein kinase [Pirellulales bacterium]